MKKPAFSLTPAVPGQHESKVGGESRGFEMILILFVSFALLLGGSNVGCAQPALTVSPSTISNTYTGVITLNISGLLSGESVTVQRWIDLNGNGVIDAGEPMMDAGKITDNDLTSNLIGGVTNINVPYDSNPTNGVITTTLNFAPNLVLENMVGHFVYKVVSPTARFAPVSALFVVTNATLNQSLSGIVYSNGATPFPYAVVVAQDPRASITVGAAVADSSGHYFLTMPPGNYSLLAAHPDAYFDQSLAPTVVLANGMAATNDLFLTNGTVTISGSVFNAANSNGIGGLLLTFDSGNNFAITFTDTNGNYSAAVTPNFWKIRPAKERLARRAYVVSQNSLQANTTADNVTNANIALLKGNALFYGRITDNASVPFANIALDANDGTNNQFSAKGYSDANGYYAVVALGTNSDWNCNANGGNLALNNYILNNFNNTNILATQTIQENFVALPVTASISGQVRDNLGNPVTGVELYASTFIGGIFYQSLNGQTDNSGNYSLGVISGSWQLYFSFGGETGLDNLGLVDYFAPHDVSLPPTNAVLNLTVYQDGVPLMSEPQHISSTQFGFNINGSVGVNYTVQVSTNLAATNWANLFSLELTNSPFPIVDTHATNSPRFYRVQKN